MTKGDHVSVMLPNGFGFPITWLAIGKLGAVMVPTNITYQEHDLVYLLSDSEARVMVVHQDYLPLLLQGRNQVPGLKEVIVLGQVPKGYHGYEATTFAASDAFGIEDVEENDPVNLQYTSGTTGFPKECMLTHHYWLLFCEVVSSYLKILPDDVTLTAQLYERCVELDIPVTIHTGINFSLTRSVDFGRPLSLDFIACDFPDLKIVANHGGWPWVNELVAVAWKHANVYIETGAVSPKYIGQAGTGWETLLRYGNSILKDQMLFASEWPLLPLERLVPEARALPLKDEVKEKYLGDNAARLLGLKSGDRGRKNAPTSSSL